MNPIVLYLASGESLYPGAARLMLATLISPRLQQRWLLRLRNVGLACADNDHHGLPAVPVDS